MFDLLFEPPPLVRRIAYGVQRHVGRRSATLVPVRLASKPASDYAVLQNIWRTARYVPRVIGGPSSDSCSAETMLLSGCIVTNCR